MIFSALKTWRKRKQSPLLHTITVIESERLPYQVGPWLAKVLGREFFDGTQAEPPRIPGKVVSRGQNFQVPKDKQGIEAIGRVVNIPEILELADPDETQMRSTQWRAELIRGILQKLNWREALGQ
jgi:hypothetical protein